MPTPHVTRVFVPGEVIQEKSEGLDAASADDSFYVVGVPGRYELAGYMVPLHELQHRGIPENIADLVHMIVGLNTSEHVILLHHDGDLWELLVQNGKGLPETYTFRDRPKTSPQQVTMKPTPTTAPYRPRRPAKPPAKPRSAWFAWLSASLR